MVLLHQNSHQDGNSFSQSSPSAVPLLLLPRVGHRALGSSELSGFFQGPWEAAGGLRGHEGLEAGGELQGENSAQREAGNDFQGLQPHFRAVVKEGNKLYLETSDLHRALPTQLSQHIWMGCALILGITRSNLLQVPGLSKH